MSGGESKTTAQLDCEVCCETFTKTTHKKITCGQCELTVCRKCVRVYLMNSTTKAHCMKCKSEWDREFTQKNIGKSYFNKEYNNHRKDILFETEKARFPETMPLVVRYRNLEKWKKESWEDRKKIEELRVQMWRLEANIRERDTKIRNSDYIKEKKQFIKKCPVGDCEGYLSTSWKCGVCNTKVCPECFVIKNKDEEHKCNKDDLASAEAIKKETRACPSCGIRIYKISGCDQMWCTSCHVAFSWRTGLKVNGVIHNPHFYAWQRDNNNNIQNPGAQICGGVPTFQNIRESMHAVRQTSTFIYLGEDVIQNLFNNNEDWIRYTAPGRKPKKIWRGIKNTIYNMHRGAMHLQHVTLDRLRRDCQHEVENEDLRIKFICKEITEDGMKKTLMKRNKAFEKKHTALNVYELMGAVMTEVLITINNTAYEFSRNNNFSFDYETDEQIENSKQNLITCLKTIHENVIKLNKVRIYCNIELCKISKNYNQAIEVIDGRYTMCHWKKQGCIEELKKDIRVRGLIYPPAPVAATVNVGGIIV